MTDHTMARPSHGPTEKMTLRTTLTSPFGRKVRIAAQVLGVSALIEVVPADTMDEGDSLRQQNPLGKMPCLLLGDGTAMYDSRVIIEYLESLVEQPSLTPSAGLERYQALTAASLCDGITDAALLMVYERRFRAPEQVSERWLAHQRGKVERALATMEQNPPDPTKTTIAAINLACALGYLDWRQPVEWRTTHPRLVEWLNRFSASEPAFRMTARPEEVDV